jgi:hypothetical protein
MQKAAYALNNINVKYDLNISVNKTKMMAINGKMIVTTKIVINHIIEQVNSFNCLRYIITATRFRNKCCRIYGSMTNNIGFWTGLDLLTTQRS